MTDQPTPEQTPERMIAEIRKRVEKATEGPWTATFGYDGGATVAVMRDWRDGNVAASVIGPDAWIHSADKSQPDANAAFIAHAREDVPFLLSQLDALTATLAHLTQERDEWRASASGYGSDAVEWKIRAEQAEGTLAHLKEQAMKIPVWKCKACGCLWRDNLDDTVSLLNVEQKSCQRCEHLSTRTACEIHWLDAALVDPLVSSSTTTKT